MKSGVPSRHPDDNTDSSFLAIFGGGGICVPKLVPVEYMVSRYWEEYLSPASDGCYTNERYLCTLVPGTQTTTFRLEAEPDTTMPQRTTVVTLIPEYLPEGIQPVSASVVELFKVVGETMYLSTFVMYDKTNSVVCIFIDSPCLVSLPQPLDMVIGQNEKKLKLFKIGMAIVKNDRGLLTLTTTNAVSSTCGQCSEPSADGSQTTRNEPINVGKRANHQRIPLVARVDSRLGSGQKNFCSEHLANHLRTVSEPFGSLVCTQL
ncbi:hypothetical protein ACFE04_019565 [Oxalis oulophora]